MYRTLTLKLALTVLLTAVIVQQSNAQLANGKSKFLGNIIAGSAPSSFSTYWNQVTPENGGKWGTVQGGGQNSWNWSQCDVAYNYANSRGYKFKFHTLVWGAQYPSWITSLSSSAQRTAIQNWMNAVKNRYSNIWAIDVVNEPVKTACPFKNALGGNGSTGWDWVITAFQMARSTFPGRQLLINEYGTENDAGARGTMKTIINLLKSRGLIDGIGIQAHAFNLDNMSASQMTTCLNDYASLGLPIYISELDIRGQGSTVNETAQKNKYAELFPVMWNHGSVQGITLWGYIVGQTWLANTGIVNSNGTERQAMVWLKSFMGGSGSSLTVSPTSLSVGSTSGSSTVTVTSNVSWSVTDDQSWLSESPTSGSNNGSFSVTRTANTSTSSRSGTVTVTGGGITRTMTVTQSGTGGGSNTIIVRARGTNGSESIQLRVNNSTIATWTLTTSLTNYTATTSTTGGITVNFTNDASGRDVQVDYIQVNGSTRQAENQSTNTGVWQNSQCGGSNSEWLHCNGYIGFGNLPKSSEEELSQPSLPKNFYLEQNYPNPFNPTTTISFSIPEISYVSLKVYNSLGQEIAELGGREYSAGRHSVTFNASNLASGVYYYTIKAGENAWVEKMILQK